MITQRTTTIRILEKDLTALKKAKAFPHEPHYITIQKLLGAWKNATKK